MCVYVLYKIYLMTFLIHLEVKWGYSNDNENCIPFLPYFFLPQRWFQSWIRMFPYDISNMVYNLVYIYNMVYKYGIYIGK